MNRILLIALSAALFAVVCASGALAKNATAGTVRVSNTVTAKNGKMAALEEEGADSKSERKSSLSDSKGVLTIDDVDQAAAYQGLVRIVSNNLDAAEALIVLMRRQTAPPSKNQIDDIQFKLEVAEDALDELAVRAKYSSDRAQEQALKDRLAGQKISLEVLRRRLGVESTANVFGMEFFRGAAGREEIEATMVPANYVLRIHDKLSILLTSQLGAQTSYNQSIGTDGTINLTGIGKIKASGLNISQLNALANQRVSEKYNQMRVEIAVDGVYPISVQIAGSVLNPGTYNLSGLSTLIAALNKAGGPTPSGSLRNIQLSRAGEPKKQLDMYEFFIEGSKEPDVALRDGDLIFVPPVGKTITVDGEVVRPARYEPDFPLSLADAVELAAGPKSSGYLQHVSVERIENGEYRILINTPINDESAKTFKVQPGDQISITSVRPERTNIVTITGPVNVPGDFALSENMRVSDLISLAQGLDPSQEVCPWRADILRVDSMAGSKLISFDLEKALQKDPEQNIELQKLDRVFLYLPDQVAFRNNRIRLSGAVSNPGVYDRKNGMKISDAIAASGGVLPEAHLERADLVRYTEDGLQELVKVDLRAALSRKPDEDLLMHDRDELKVYTTEQIGWRDSRVRVEGYVQRPGTYKRVENMRVSDLLFAAGGLLPEAGQMAELGRVSEAGNTSVIKIDVALLKSGEIEDILLCDRDTLTVASLKSVLRKPEVVYLSGEVKNPGPYALSDGSEKLTDLVARAGGLSEKADTNGLILLRKKESFDNTQQRKDISAVLEKILSFADKQMLAQLTTMGINPPAGLLEQARTTSAELGRPLGASDVIVQEDGLDYDEGDTRIEAVVASIEEKKKEKAGQETDEDEEEVEREVQVRPEQHEEDLGPPRAMGERLEAADEDEPDGLAAGIRSIDLLELARVSLDFNNAMQDPASTDNITLRDGDRIHIPRFTDTVTVLGAVLHPHTFVASTEKKAAYYIERSGGFSGDAVRKAVIVVHANGDAVPADKVKYVVAGDVIVVPNTGLVDVASKWEKVGSVTKVISDVLSSVYMLIKL